jgi:hypothetical protein
MDYKCYERKINDIIMKCPIEAGVEILVYNVIDETIDFNKMSLVDINRLWKDRDERLTTEGGIPDIAVLPVGFEYQKEATGEAYGFVEVKAVNKELCETERILVQKAKCPHFIYTNGLIWKYYLNQILKWQISLATIKKKECKWIKNAQLVSIDSKKFNELIEALKNINWADNTKNS